MAQGHEPWNLHNTVKDSDVFNRKELSQKIEYPKHDGKLTFDLLENLQRRLVCFIEEIISSLNSFKDLLN
jgi:hypothetical protein